MSPKSPAASLLAVLLGVTSLAAIGRAPVSSAEAAVGSAQEAGEIEAVESVDLARYAGVWYEISRFPNWFQDDCAGEVTATYRLRDDGRIDVINECSQADGSRKRAQGIAKLAENEGSASKLKVRFAPRIFSWLPFVWADYWILYLDDDYTRVAVGTPGRDYLWILCRKPEPDDDEVRPIVERLAAMGFDVERLVRTRQAR